MLKPKLSIITVTYNAEQVLQKTIESVIEQSYENLEFLIIDGGSKDATTSIIKSYEKHINIWISEPDNGIYDAMNKGLALANGEYVWFINAGDKPFNKHTAKEIMMLAINQNADVIYGDTILINEKDENLGMRHGKTPDELKYTSFKHGMNVCHQAFICRKKLVEKYELKWGIAADIDWILTILKKNPKVTNTKSVIAQFLIAGASSANLSKSWKSRYKVLKHHYGGGSNFINHIYIALRYVARKLKK